MKNPGGSDDLLELSRAALLDALEALSGHRQSVIVIGAQAVYLRTESAPVALAEATKDSDLALDPRTLGEDPHIEVAMVNAGFLQDSEKGQPGTWINAAGIPVDLMVPEALAGPGRKNRRGARIPPHDKRATRRARGLEAAVVDFGPMEISALGSDDPRIFRTQVAGSAALLVAKVHKIAERISTPDRLNDKDAHDSYRILIHADTDSLSESFGRLLDDPVSRDVTEQAVSYIRELFAAGPEAEGSKMAGRAEEGLGEPETVALATSILAGELLEGVARRT